MKINVYCKNIDQKLEVEAGCSLADIACSLGDKLPFNPICCRVNNKTEALGTRLPGRGQGCIRAPCA